MVMQETDPGPFGAVGSTRESELFVLKAARSVAEVQNYVNFVADISVLLEVLGYTKEDAMKNGFNDLHDLARRIYDFVDIFETSSPVDRRNLQALTLPVPSTGRRFAEGFGISFGFFGSLILLFATGVSLWLALGLQLSVTTVFMAGVISGLLISEGPVQSFNRLFSFYYTQDNICETSRVLKRHYMLVFANLAVATSVWYAVTLVAGIPFDLFTVGLISLVTVSMHRASYAIIYVLKKVGHLTVSYLGAFFSLLLVYYATPILLPDATTRYFVALGVAFVILSSTAVYDHYKIFSGRSRQEDSHLPSFFRPIGINAVTIKSRLHIQLWETAPYYIYGTFFFVMMFGDRALSWIFNPVRQPNGVNLPFVFNSVYHAGADTALLILFPVLIVQYVMMSPIFVQVANRTLTHTVSDLDSIDDFLHQRYKRVLAASLLTAVVTAMIVNYVVPKIAVYPLETPTSIAILSVASVSNIFMAIFTANSTFIILLNRTKWLAVIAVVGSVVVLGLGAVLAQSGFANIIFAYLVATAGAAVFSTACARYVLTTGASTFFARFS